MKQILSSATVCLISVFATPVALAQALYAFNLPQQALADSLRAISRQTAMNILFEPATVENVTAPAVRGSERYAVAPNMFLELIVNNIANRQPPVDPTNSFYPYYDSGSYNGYGRAYWLEFGARFGGSRQ